MKKIPFVLLVLFAAGLQFNLSPAFAKASGTSRLNPASSDSSIIYSQLEMQEMQAEAEKNSEKAKNLPESSNRIVVSQPAP